MVWMTTGLVRPPRTRQKLTWLVVSTHLKSFSQIGSFPKKENMKNIWNHHLVTNVTCKGTILKGKDCLLLGSFPDAMFTWVLIVHLENSHCQVNSHQLITLKNSNPVAPPPRKWLLFPGICFLLSFNPLESCVFAQQVKLNHFLHVPGIC